MTERHVHVTPHDNGWQVRHEAELTPIEEHATEDDAERAAEAHARAHGEREVVVHGRDGRIKALHAVDDGGGGGGREPAD